jgi:hypothetical protein
MINKETIQIFYDIYIDLCSLSDFHIFLFFVVDLDIRNVLRTVSLMGGKPLECSLTK